MNKRVAIALLLVLILLTTLACIGGVEGSAIGSADATATSAAAEFHIQLTLVAQDYATPVP